MSSNHLNWDPAKYVEFGDFRNRPFFELMNRVVSSEAESIVDLGCGPGNLTATLAQRWPSAQVVGIDSSAEMIATANKQKDPALTNLSFEVADINLWTPPEDLDVLVSNAALQWVPAHRDLLRGWLAALRAGSWIAVQVPNNFTAASHVLMRELAESQRWGEKLEGVLRHEDAVDTPAQYLELLLEAGTEADVWETTYSQLLTGKDPVLEWVRATGLRPVLHALSAEDSAQFEAEYAQKLRAAYPETPSGTVFPFSRIFMVARKL